MLPPESRRTKNSGTPMRAAVLKQTSCRLVRLNATLDLTLVKSRGTEIYAANQTPPLVRSEDGFRHRAGLEQAETEQNGVAHNAPNGVDGIPGNRYRLYQHGVNRHADEDEKALKTQCKQAFQIVLPHVALLVVAEGRHGDGRKAHHAVNFNHSSVDDDENHDGQDAHGNADEEGLQKQPEQGADIHLHQAGLQHGQANVVDTGISGNDAAGIGYHLLGDIEHRHHDVKSIADEPHRNSSLKNPAHDEGRLKLCHIVVLGNHLDQFVTGDKGQDDACNGQHHVPGQRFDHGEHPWLKAGGLGAHLLCDVAHLGVHIIKQAGEIGHNACRQDAFDPVGNGFENGFHSVTVLS